MPETPTATPAHTSASGPDLRRVAIVIVAYDSPAGLLEEAVASVLTAIDDTSESTIEVTVDVVDNGDQAGVRLAPYADRVRIRPLGTNAGFAAAVNSGFRRGLEEGADFLACLNDDVAVTPGWLDPLLEALDGNPTLGGVQPLLVASDGTTIDGAGIELDRYGAGSDRLRGRPASDARAEEVVAITGGAAMFRSEFVRDVGLLDERFFLYYEDVEWCRRGGRHGWRFAVVPDSVVIHHGSATTQGIGTRVRVLQERNRLWESALHGTRDELLAGAWLSIRRLRHPPRRAHARALMAGLAGAAPLLVQRWRSTSHRDPERHKSVVG